MGQNDLQQIKTVQYKAISNKSSLVFTKASNKNTA